MSFSAFWTGGNVAFGASMACLGGCFPIIYTVEKTLIGHVVSPHKLGDVDLLILALGGLSGDFDLLMKVDRRHCGLIR